MIHSRQFVFSAFIERSARSILVLLIALALGIALALATGCAPGVAKPRVQPPMIEGALKTLPNGGAVVTEVTFKKSEILDREFLYGADLQYSSVGDLQYSLITQVLAIGHWDARFRILNGQNSGSNGTAHARLQLVADQRTLFESDINHPERLIHEFEIVSQTADTVTVRMERGSSVLPALLGQSTQPRTSWVRSVEYDPNGNYLLFETSIESADGNVIEFMESLFPRETLVAPAIAAGFKPLLNDRDREPMAERFRFISNASVFLDLPNEGRVLTQVAVRYPYHPKHAAEPIRWFVTPNVPDAYLGDIRTGVEAWNRYSQKLWGVDMVRFEGKLPAGVKVGDPRYNVISWDSVAEAGAAYESQAADLRTGIQSHSLIYLPNAWLNIGRKYWKDGDLSAVSKNPRAGLGEGLAAFRGLPVNCMHDAGQKLSLELAFSSPGSSPGSFETFARELLKGVLFHEVGHALGLSHNFKGSLVWNPEDPSTPITTSVMDYNQYALERTIFDGVDQATGPVLEYDRQILSVLYNDGSDLSSSDGVLPACDDADADLYMGGPDPLCVRYDAGREPTEQLLATIAIVSDSPRRLGSTVSLPGAIDKLLAGLGDPTAVKDLEAATGAVAALGVKMSGLVNFYYAVGAQSLSSAARAAAKSLYVAGKQASQEITKLAVEKGEEGMRLRALEGLEWVLTHQGFSADTRAALDRMMTGASAWLLQTPPFSGLGDQTDPRRERYDSLMDLLKRTRAQLESTSELAALTRLRTAVLGALVRREGAPFYFSVSDAGVFDVEARVLAWLEAASLRKDRASTERARAVSSLKTFEGLEAGDLTLSRVRDALVQELRSARNAAEREALRKLVRLAAPASRLSLRSVSG
jgi:hypothetical protein